MVGIGVAVAALRGAVTVWVSGHVHLGLVREPPQLPVIAPAPWASWEAFAGARAALCLAVADLPCALAEQREAPVSVRRMLKLKSMKIIWA